MKASAFVLAFFVCLFCFSCASNKERPKDEFFYEENFPLFKEAELSNGIRVVVKNIPFEKNVELRVLFAGGAAACPKGKSGLDQLTFDLLSEANPKAKERLARGQYFSLWACQNDFSWFGFSAAAPDFWESLEIFAASLLSPEYSHEEYIKKEAAAASGALSRSENPRHELLDAVKKNIYALSPYMDGIFYKPSSRVSEYDIEKNLAALLNAKRMTIVAAGNFSYHPKAEKGGRREKKTDQEFFEDAASRLEQELEGLFGGIEAKDWSAPAVPELKINDGAKKTERSEFAGGDYYSALCFACPNRGDDDYEAFALSTLALDSVLSREMVEKQKVAVYCGTAVLNSTCSAALIVASGKNSSRDVLEFTQAALKAFPTEYELRPVLDFYKNLYVSRVVGASHNAGATLDQMASGLFYQDGAKAFIERPKKIRGATVQDVRAAFEKYFLADNSLYVLLAN